MARERMVREGERCRSAFRERRIVHALDPLAAKFLAELLGLPEPKRFGPFVGVELHSGVTLDFIRALPEEILIEHYAPSW